MQVLTARLTGTGLVCLDCPWCVRGACVVCACRMARSAEGKKWTDNRWRRRGASKIASSSEIALADQIQKGGGPTHWSSPPLCAPVWLHLDPGKGKLREGSGGMAAAALVEWEGDRWRDETRWARWSQMVWAHIVRHATLGVRNQIKFFRRAPRQPRQSSPTLKCHVDESIHVRRGEEGHRSPASSALLLKFKVWVALKRAV